MMRSIAPLLFVGASFALPDTAPKCTMLPLPALRDSVSTYFVAVALADTAPAKAGRGPTRVLDVASFSAPPGLKPPPAPDTVVFGQIVRVERVGGAQVERLSAVLERGGREWLLVPWAYQADCSPVLWTEGAQWVEPTTQGFYRAQLRPDSEWVGARPTFDVAGAWLQPYPTGRLVASARRGGQGNVMETLTPNQLFELYAVLPDYDALRRNREQALGPVERWERAHPDLAARWPAASILASVRAFVREVGH